MEPEMMGTVYFIGAGPGAPDLITVRGMRILQHADVVIYAGSLVSSQLIQESSAHAEHFDSSSLNLDQILERMVEAARQGLTVARLHSGDPAVYGAIREQMIALRTLRIPFEVVPGVSSVFAAAALLETELTVPGISQTVILTRTEGRASPMPPGASLRDLAAIPATLAIFLSAALVGRMVEDLLEGGMAPTTPVVVVVRATWPDQQVIWSSLETLRRDVRDARIQRHALFLIGPALAADVEGGGYSRLYDKTYTHMFRRGASGEP